MLGIIHLQSLESVLGALDHLFRHPGHPCDVDSETVRRPAFLELAQENHLSPDLLHGDVEVPDS